MSRRGCAALLALVALLCEAHAQAADVNRRAEALNEEGKALYTDHDDYGGAAEKFRAAIAIQPDARYYYNLCVSLEKLEQYRDALDACDAVFDHEPREELATKTGKRAAQIRKRYREWRAARGPANQPVPPDDAPASAEPAQASTSDAIDAIAVSAPLADYGFGLGADLGALGNSGVGAREHGSSGVALRIHGDLLIAPRYDVGATAYLHVAMVAERDITTPYSLTIFDLGVAAYWHRHLWRRLYVTPLGGLHAAALATNPGDRTRTYGTFGLRFEGNLEWLFGDGRHALRLTPISLNVYFSARQIAGQAEDAAVYGFDQGGATWSFLVGYTMRFAKTPFPGLALE